MCVSHTSAAAFGIYSCLSPWMLANERDAVSRVSSFVCYISWRIEKHLLAFLFPAYIRVLPVVSVLWPVLTILLMRVWITVDYVVFRDLFLLQFPPFPLKSNNSTLRVYVGLSLCVNVIFCEKDLITKFNKVYFFFSSVAGCLIFSLVNLCLIYYRQLWNGRQTQTKENELTCWWISFKNYK